MFYTVTSYGSIGEKPVNTIAKSVESILNAADAGLPGVEKLMRNARQSLKVPHLEALLIAGNTDATLAAVAATQIPPAETALLEALIAAVSSNVALPESVTFGVEFNEVNQRIIRWAKANVAKNIQGVSPANIAVIRDTIVQSLEAGVGPRVTAAHIQDLIGLTPGHEKAVNRLYFKSLEDGVTETQARKVAARKAKQLIRWRAEMIARTETIRAANEGQMLVWETARDMDLIPQGTKTIWLATGDDRTCPICAVLDGQTVAISERYVINRQAISFVRSGSDFKVAGTKPLPKPRTERTPPAHQSCRCTLILERL